MIDFDDYDGVESEDELFHEDEDDTLEDSWYHGYVMEDSPPCPFGVGDDLGLCVREKFGCHFFGCEFSND